MKANRQYYGVVKVQSDYEVDLLDTAISTFKNYLTRQFSYAQFRPEYVGNLDLLAKETYGDEKLWWVIAITNDVTDPFDSSNTGLLLKLPDILDVYDFYNDHYQNYSSYGS